MPSEPLIPKDMPPVDSNQHPEQLTEAIKAHATGARSAPGLTGRVRHAVECGKALLAMRQLLSRGAWNDWLQERCGLNRMTANRYIRLARQAHLLSQCTSIRQAYLAAGVIRRQEQNPESPPAAT